MSPEAWVALACGAFGLAGVMMGGLIFWTSIVAGTRATLVGHLKDCARHYTELEDRIARIEHVIDLGVQNQQQMIAQLNQLIGQIKTNPNPKIV